MKAADIISEKRSDILRLSKIYGARNVRVFGSVARGEEEADSDIDILVELDEGRSLLDLGGLLMDLQKLLGRKVDVVTEKGLHWYIKDKILQEARPI
ncbi:MAG: nucleotidyltransferase family protein [Proteobacteria bacterium]|nr:nucleotidyltransferase family protein [Pseudomonadota bacterium]